MVKRYGSVLNSVALLTVLSTALSASAATPTRPIANDDKATLASAAGVSVPVLANDVSTDGTATLRVHSIGTPKYGYAVLGPKQTIIYKPGPNFAGVDSFRYSIVDSSGLSASATVTIVSPRYAFAGPLAASIVDKDGLQVGYLRLDATATGAFSGKVQIGTKRYDLVGSLDAKGRYVGYARDSDFKVLALSLRVVQNGGITTLTGTFGGTSEWTVSEQVNGLTVEGLKNLAGRYTVELPPFSTSDSTNGSSSSGSGPQGSGWMAIKVNEQGNVRMEGKTGDGRSFSTSAQLAGSDSVPTLPFLIADDGTVLGGTLTIGDTVAGSIGWVREETGEDLYPHGFDLTISASGSRYIKPDGGKRVLSTDSNDGGRATITISGGGVEGFSREFKISEDDEAIVPDPGEDRVNLEIDRDSGIFKGKFRKLDDRDQRLKFSGVVIQSEGRAAGVFAGKNKSGRVELDLTSESSDNSDSTDVSTDGSVTATGGDGTTVDSSGGVDLSGDQFSFGSSF